MKRILEAKYNIDTVQYSQSDSYSNRQILVTCHYSQDWLRVITQGFNDVNEDNLFTNGYSYGFN